MKLKHGILKKSIQLLIWQLSLLCLLTACAPAPREVRLDLQDVSLAEASYSVSRSISSLSEVAQAAHPLPKLDPPPNPASYGMGGLASVEWSGPIRQIVEQIAKMTGYRVRILGTEPSIPVIITLYDKNRMAADILRDIGFQAGRRAAVVVYPECRVIELRYAKN